MSEEEVLHASSYERPYRLVVYALATCCILVAYFRTRFAKRVTFECSCDQIGAKVAKILAQRDYNPPLYAGLDYYGQLQTILHFIARHLTILLQKIVLLGSVMDYSR